MGSVPHLNWERERKPRRVINPDYFHRGAVLDAEAFQSLFQVLLAQKHPHVLLEILHLLSFRKVPALRAETGVPDDPSGKKRGLRELALKTDAAEELRWDGTGVKDGGTWVCHDWTTGRPGVVTIPNSLSIRLREGRGRGAFFPN
jgi:hypothetical protein